MSDYTSSFVVNYAELINRSHYLNPPNEGQSTLSTYVGKPVRCIARATALIAIATFLGPIGAFYNGLQALADYPEKRTELFKKHAYAATNDAVYGYMTVSAFALSYFAALHIFLPPVGIFFIAASCFSGILRTQMLSMALPVEHYT